MPDRRSSRSARSISIMFMAELPVRWRWRPPRARTDRRTHRGRVPAACAVAAGRPRLAEEKHAARCRRLHRLRPVRGALPVRCDCDAAPASRLTGRPPGLTRRLPCVRAQPGHDVGAHLVAVGLVQDFVAATRVQLDRHIGQTRLAVALAQQLDERAAAGQRIGIA